MFVEPQERLACTPQFNDLVEDQSDRSLYPAIGILSKWSPAFTKPTGAATMSSPRLAFS